jgi:hypothetical protein
MLQKKGLVRGLGVACESTQNKRILAPRRRFATNGTPSATCLLGIEAGDGRTASRKPAVASSLVAASPLSMPQGLGK